MRPVWPVEAKPVLQNFFIRRSRSRSKIDLAEFRSKWVNFFIIIWFVPNWGFGELIHVELSLSSMNLGESSCKHVDHSWLSTG